MGLEGEELPSREIVASEWERRGGEFQLVRKSKV